MYRAIYTCLKASNFPKSRGYSNEVRVDDLKNNK